MIRKVTVRELISMLYQDPQRFSEIIQKEPLHVMSGRGEDDSDPTIALLEAFACIGEILTFYQERIDSESYLRTAKERASILHLMQILEFLKSNIAKDPHSTNLGTALTGLLSYAGDYLLHNQGSGATGSNISSSGEGELPDNDTIKKNRVPTRKRRREPPLADEQIDVIRQIANQVTSLDILFSNKGFFVLFSGESGTGKTMAAEVLANEAGLDLYRIDLSQVVSKYIGETEKNLQQIFDAAEESGAILLFDEADALFGKRTEVKDSHDRYANIEISSLLQKMEAYPGLIIITTKTISSLDPRLLNRIRFFIHFPSPDSSRE